MEMPCLGRCHSPELLAWPSSALVSVDGGAFVATLPRAEHPQVLGSFQHFFYAGRLDPVLFALWVSAVVLATIRSVVVLRRPDARRGRIPWIVGLLLAPYVALALTILAFTVGHGHPLAQYNAAGGVNWYSTWVRAWPLLVWGGLGGCAGSFLAFVVGAIRDSRVPDGTPHGGALGGILVANILSLVCVFENFPSA